MPVPRRDANHWSAAAGLVAVLVIDRLTHEFFGDITLAPLVSVIVLASLTLRLEPREILLWAPLYALLSFLLLTYWRGSFVWHPSPLPPDITSSASFWQAVVRSSTVTIAGGLCAALSHQKQKLQALLDEKTAIDSALTEANARMNLAARGAHFGFWHFRVTEDREEWDENLCRIYGSDPGESNPRWEKFLHPEDREEAEKRLRKVLDEGGIYDSEFRIVRPDGVVRHIRESGFVVHDKEGRAISANGADIDVTEEKLAEQKRRESEQEHRAELERKLKTSLAAAAVAHEINQPLSAILLDSQMALDRIKGDSPELVQARQFLTSTIARAERTVGTVNKMMSLLRSVQTDKTEVDLVDVVRSAELYAKDELRDANAKLLIIGAAEAVPIRGDEGQLLLAVANLLRNSIEAVKSNDTSRARQIVIALSRTKKSVTLCVADSGPGLPRETLAKIPLHTTKPEGTGLGLFIVQSVADNHGAKLEAGRSELGGAELRLIFPAAN
jgi:PAS domain S-box-containing protein